MCIRDSSNKKMIHENSSENNDWYDITNSDWDIHTSPHSSSSGSSFTKSGISALKLDYTT